MADPLTQDTSVRAGGIVIPGDTPRGRRDRRPPPQKNTPRHTPQSSAPPAYKSIDLEQARSENPGIRVTQSDAVAVDEKGRIFPAARMTGKKLSNRFTSPIVILNPADLEDPEKAQAIAEEGLYTHLAGNQGKAGILSFYMRGLNIDGSKNEKDLRRKKMKESVDALKDEWPRICEEGKELVSKMHANYSSYLELKAEMEEILYMKGADYDTEDILSGWIKSHWRSKEPQKYNSQREKKVDEKINALIDEGMAKPLSPSAREDTEKSAFSAIHHLPESMRKLLNLSGTSIQLSEVSRLEYLTQAGLMRTGGTRGSFLPMNGRVHIERKLPVSECTLAEELTHYIDHVLGFSDRMAFKRAMNKDYEALKKTGDEFMMDSVFAYRDKEDLFDEDSPYPKSHRATELLANIAVGDIFPPDHYTHSEFREHMQQYMPRSYAQYETFKEEMTKAANQLERGEVVRNRRGMGHD